ncbi:alpha/beta hydrolase [Paenibacillus glycanilyticus]|uniref:alpha/beta hydrolase n=1 Tax=Paenibacillus glycanilyticus TaxID=126569 RepID=UPI00190FC369|nr:alpha/beta fold hydrolase [Paenibacillus glycanilyticus]
MQQEAKNTIMWLTGWGMPNTAFDRLSDLLPEFEHHAADYSKAASVEEFFQITENAAKNLLSANSGKLLIAGWSLGGILALKLSIQGLADGLILFSATARFTRPTEQKDYGWADSYVRRMIRGIGKDRQLTEGKFRQLAFTEFESTLLHPAGTWTTTALSAGLEVLRLVDCSTQLPNINQPALLVHGTEDKVCPYKAAEEMLAQLPLATLVSIPDRGHAAFLKNEICLAESIRSWWHVREKNRDRASI